MTQDHKQPYAARVLDAYAELVAERQNRDVPIHELYQRVGGSLPELHDFLRYQCRAQRCVPTSGEPMLASEEAKRTALHLPGETDAFLNVKLIEPPPMTQEQREAKPDHERYEELLRATAALRYPPEERTPELA
jgi:hypothetical protein